MIHEIVAVLLAIPTTAAIAVVAHEALEEHLNRRRCKR